ncbi:hypothetical protein Tco_0904438, partial [Tanacetum coccineum]
SAGMRLQHRRLYLCHLSMLGEGEEGGERAGVMEGEDSLLWLRCFNLEEPLDRFPAQSVRSSNASSGIRFTILTVLNTRMSQIRQQDMMNQIVTVFMIDSSGCHCTRPNRYPVDTSLIHIEARSLLIASCFLDVDSGRDFPFTIVKY